LKGMAIELIFKWIILVVMLLIAIGLIIYFSNNIKEFLNNFFQNKEPQGGIVVDSPTFSSSQLKTYIKACWDKYGNKTYSETICYILKGNVNGVDPSSLTSTLQSSDLVDTTKFNNQNSLTVVKDTGRKIAVESVA